MIASRFTRTTSKLVAVALIVAFLATGLGPSARVSAQTVDGNSYASEQFPLTLTWQDPWTIDESTITTNTGFERVKFNSDSGILDVVLINPTEDPGVYLDVLVNNANSGVENFQEISRDEGPGYFSAIVSYTFQLDSGPTDFEQYFEINDISGGSKFKGGEIFTASLIALAGNLDAAYDSVQNSFVRNDNAQIFISSPGGGSNQSAQPTATPKPKAKKTPTEATTGEGGIDGDTFLSPIYGYSVSWDDALWTPADESTAKSDVLLLESDTSQIEIVAAEGETNDIGDCVSERAKLVKAEDGVSGFTRLTRRYTMPDIPNDAFQRLYGYSKSIDGGDPVDLVVYIECRHLSEGNDTISFTFFTTDEAYEDELPNFLDVRDSLDLEGATSTNAKKTTPEPTEEPAEETPTSSSTTKIGKKATATPKSDSASTKPGLQDGVFNGRDFDFSVAFDPASWDPREMLEDDDTVDIALLQGEVAFVTISAGTNFDGDTQNCVDTALDGFQGDPKYSDLGTAPRKTKLPATADDALNGAFTYTFTPEDGDPVETLFYIDCRPLPEAGAVLRITFDVPADQWSDQLPLLQELLDGVTTGSGSNGNHTEPEPSPTPKKTTKKKTPTPEPSEFIGVAGNTYTSPLFGFSVTFDSQWNVTGSTSKDGSDTLSLNNGTSDALFLGLFINADTAACQQRAVDTFAAGEGITNFNPVKGNDDQPIYGSGASGTYGLYSFTQNANTFFMYIQCQTSPGGDYNVVFIQQIPIDSFQQELDGMNALSNSVEF